MRNQPMYAGAVSLLIHKVAARSTHRLSNCLLPPCIQRGRPASPRNVDRGHSRSVGEKNTL